MSFHKYEITCSPHSSDKFILWNNDIKIYRITDVEKNEKYTGIQLSNNRNALFLYALTDPKSIKCFSWYNFSDIEDLVAFGQTNGTVKIKTLGFSDKIIDKDFVSKYLRQCNSVVWNPHLSNLLVAGFEKHRLDSAVYLWDVSRFISDNYQTFTKTEATNKPLMEFGMNETVNSLTWCLDNQTDFVAGINGKSIQIFDIRSSIKNNATFTRAVNGIVMDPFITTNFASFIDSSIYIWDLRNIEKPVQILNSSLNINKICWNPFRQGLLAVILRDEVYLKCFDMRQVGGGSDVEPYIAERVVTPFNNEILSSASWIYSKGNLLLVVSNEGNLIQASVEERISLCWNSGNNIIGAAGTDLFNCMLSELDDISESIKLNSLLFYSGKEKSNLEFEFMDNKLQYLNRILLWIQRSHNLSESLYNKQASMKCNHRFQVMPSAGNQSFCGVRTFLYGPYVGQNPPKVWQSSTCVQVPWSGLDNFKSICVKMFCSEERDLVLRLCGWGYERDGDVLELLLIELENQENFTKAATLAVFNLKLQRALKSLSLGSKQDPKLVSVQMALSGFTDEKNTVWKETCTNLRKQLEDPYLNAMFAFLTEQNPYEGVLDEEGIDIEDRIAFASLFLSDLELINYLEKLTAKYIKIGNLDGILLTGFSLEGLDLIQNYVDSTSDLYSVSLLAMHGLRGELVRDERVKNWIESWKLWSQRAQFDIQLHQLNPSFLNMKQLFLTCTFCSKTIVLQQSGEQHVDRTSYTPKSSTSTNVPNLSSCPQCRKPLPRCSLCLKYMGTESHPDQPLRLWFTWCQSCHHGGHTLHLKDWFKEHIECPVSGCYCKCMSLDIGIS